MRADKLRSKIADMRKLEKRTCTSRNRFAFYRYLASVYDLYRRLRRGNKARKTAEQLRNLTGIPYERQQHPIRMIIDVTSLADDKTKSRWCLALRYAWRERKRWGDLEDFLRANGGPAGCSDKWADQRAEMRTPPGYVRVGGEHRVPLIPLFLGVEMLTPLGQPNGTS